MARCLSHPKNTPLAERTEARGRVRSLRRDEHEEVRHRTAARMATESGQRPFVRRSSIAETPFADLKGVLGLRQFRHRGWEKVDHEWRWSGLSRNRNRNRKQRRRALARWRTFVREARTDSETEHPLDIVGA